MKNNNTYTATLTDGKFWTGKAEDFVEATAKMWHLRNEIVKIELEMPEPEPTNYMEQACPELAAAVEGIKELSILKK